MGVRPPKPGDPLALARWLDAGGLDDLARWLWEKRHLPPGWLDERTPHEVAFLFGTKAEDDGGEIDRVAELHRINHERRAPKMLPPVAPDWLMPEVTRGR